ncbi:hypothetical protein BJ508DRAFT_333735 [Ascobolus immersus RN42]|uniref:Peptidase S33 tripeptidyl aminopeptidase-like C-terminal domain-containing protein n=1 Tax=Ascobolus immersus RN42 TaxID=1160509 RepID=A0A3N4HIP8_ASCIM|nr:hypothetical protein BJ508DRAFT_333735 [Ascobolus immersus RN42]
MRFKTFTFADRFPFSFLALLLLISQVGLVFFGLSVVVSAATDRIDRENQDDWDFTYSVYTRLFDKIQSDSTSVFGTKPILCSDLLKGYDGTNLAGIKALLPTIPPTARCGKIARPLFSATDPLNPIGYKDISYSYVPSWSCLTRPSRHRACMGPFLVAPGGPSTSGIRYLWNAASELAKDSPNHDWVGFDQRTVGFSSSGNDVCESSPRKASIFMTNVTERMHTDRIRSEHRESEQLESISRYVKDAKHYAARCKKFLETDDILRNIGVSAAADDSVAVLEAVWYQLHGILDPSKAALRMMVHSWDAIFGQIAASKHGDRFDRLLVLSGANLTFGLDFTYDYMTFPTDEKAALNFFAAYCAKGPKCSLHSLVTETTPTAGVLRVFEAVTEDDRARRVNMTCSLEAIWLATHQFFKNPYEHFDSLGKHISAPFTAVVVDRLDNDNSESISGELSDGQTNIDTDTAPDSDSLESTSTGMSNGQPQTDTEATTPDSDIESTSTGLSDGQPQTDTETTTPDSDSQESTSSTLSDGHANIDANTYPGMGTEMQTTLLRCVDIEDFGSPTDDESLKLMFKAASIGSPIHSHFYIQGWLMCAFFTDDMKSLAKVPKIEENTKWTLKTPALFISNDKDVVTPRRIMEVAATRFTGSKAVYQKGFLGHGVLDGEGKTSACIAAIVRKYLRYGSMPSVEFCPDEGPPEAVVADPFSDAPLEDSQSLTQIET